jgi:hypothetical protein
MDKGDKDMLLSVICNFTTEVAAQSFQAWAKAHRLEIDDAPALGATRRDLLWDQESDPQKSGFADHDAVLAAFHADKKSEFDSGAFMFLSWTEVLCP